MSAPSYLIGEPDEVVQLAKRSDHNERIISELKPALTVAFLTTKAENPCLEIGCREGGSGSYTMHWIRREGLGRKFYSVDSDECPQLFHEIVKNWQIQHRHYKQSQESFILEILPNLNETLGFVFLDADHSYENVVKHMKALIPYLANGAIVAVDDVDGWKEIPKIEGVVELFFPQVDQGPHTGPEGKHVAYWMKVSLGLID